METKFQTSFIPKKPIVSSGASQAPSHHHAITSLFMGLGIFAFVLSLASAGGAYAWKVILQNSQESYKKNLIDRKQLFDTDKISQLKEANVKIDMAKQLLANHIAASMVFDKIAHLTAENVRFTNLDIAIGQEAGGVGVKMSGYGSNLAAVAFQSDVLGQLDLYGLRNVVKNPILSDPQLSDKGNVTFGFTANIDSNKISYENSVSPNSDDTASTTP